MPVNYFLVQWSLWRIERNGGQISELLEKDFGDIYSK